MTISQPALLTDNKRYHKQAFLYSLAIAFLIFIPFIIIGKGVYVHYGDYNVQQIPFYQLAHDAVRSGNIFWNWNTDLGVNFIGSYSFYLLFSPFFWLTLPFPTAFVPYLMGPLLILKTACASLTAYMYLERFVKNKYYAIMGGMLYAFSGWMTFNIFFNHFHDVAVFFPLLLLAVEKLVTEDKKIFFALMVALNAMVNYWFFVGEAVFIVLYVIVRSYSGGWGITWKKFFRIAIEAMLGFLLASFAVLPSVMALSGNPRTDASRVLYGWGMWIYWHNSGKNGDYAQRLPAILSSIILPPELAAMPNFFHKHGAEWSSMSAWLPMFSISGIIAYFNQRKKPDWVKKMLALCLVFACIPVLNSLFVMLNNAYYARWFYMPILIMAMATIRAVEDSKNNIASFKAGLKWTLIPATAIAVAAGLTPDKANGEWKLGIAKQPFRVWIWYLVLVLGLALVAICIIKYRHHQGFKKLITGCLAIISVGFGLIYLTTAKLSYPRDDAILNKALGGRKEISLPDDGFFRSDIYDDDDNLLMYWGLPTIQAFHSIVPSSLMEFYPTVGVERSVGSRPEAEYYAIRSLLSVKYLFISIEKDDQQPMPGYTYYDTQHFYNIYENDNYVPMGFTYDYAVTPDMLDNFSTRENGHLMVRAMVLDQDVISENLDIIMPLPQNQLGVFDNATYFRDSANRNQKTVDDFSINRRGFTAKTNFDEPELVFFSVPYEGGWSASVNGSDAEIIKANIGFMAVRVPEGEAKIKFTYTTPGLFIGIIVTLGVGVILLAWYIIIRVRRKPDAKLDDTSLQEKLMEGETVNLSWDEYLSEFDRDTRKEKLRISLQKVENEEIIQEAQNFNFKIDTENTEKENADE